jgi:hypothetical protein
LPSASAYLAKLLLAPGPLALVQRLEARIRGSKVSPIAAAGGATGAEQNERQAS